MWSLCKIYQKSIDDPFFEEMDPVQKLWMFENWQADQIDKMELAKNHAYLLASFSHPEAVGKILGANNAFESTDEEFDESTNMVRDMNLKLLNNNTSPRKRKRGVIKG
jgi:hypothetical protein